MSITVFYSNASQSVQINVSSSESVIGIASSGLLFLGLDTINDVHLTDNKNSELVLPSLYTQNPEALSSGDLVCLQTSSNSLASNYGVELSVVDTSNASLGATQALFLLKSYTEGETVLISKGVYDYDLSDSRVNWLAGLTLYASNSIMSVTPSSLSGHWVKSLGYCVPNTNSKKRVWFNPDSTYIQRT
tara:strand:+ start:5496 stop:6062 length:567 start_codon:yes stop_codon:yes gene_type:complete